MRKLTVFFQSNVVPEVGRRAPHFDPRKSESPASPGASMQIWLAGIRHEICAVSRPATPDGPTSWVRRWLSRPCWFSAGRWY